MNLHLKSRRAIVTGGTRGIGGQIAETLALIQGIPREPGVKLHHRREPYRGRRLDFARQQLMTSPFPPPRVKQRRQSHVCFRE